MKRYFLLMTLFSLITYAQKIYPDYQGDWSKVDEFERQLLPKSALKVVDEIYHKAKSTDNAPQLIKSLLYQSKYAMILQENDQLKIIKHIELEIAQSDLPAKPILESILANIYWQYFQQNRWQFYNRTETEQKVNLDDFRTWDLATIFKEIHLHFANSLKSGFLLQNTKIEPFNSILIKGVDSKVYRPTLYDFIAHRALDFYLTDETSLTQPTYKFELDDPKLLTTAEVFSKLNLTTSDEYSLQFNALKIYQDLTKFHLKSGNLEALVLLDINRLSFVYRNSTFLDKDTVIFQTLEQSIAQYKSKAIGTMYDQYMATLYKNKGDTYSPENNQQNQWFLKQAVSVCDRAIDRFPESRGAVTCKNLKSEISSPVLNITAEEFLPINQNSRLLVQYKNIENLNFKVLQIDYDFKESLSKIYNNKGIMQKIKLLPSKKEIERWSNDLKSVGDYQQHGLEVLLPALPQGLYVILAENKNQSISGYTVVQVTNLAINEILGGRSHRLQIVDRNNGKAIAEAKVNLKSQQRHGRRREVFNENFVTDKDGYINLPRQYYYNNLLATVTHNQDKAYFNGCRLYEYNKWVSNEKTHYQTFVFTDRSIYRPGQTLYFKSIVVERVPKGKMINSETLSNAEVQVTLLDVNWQEVSQQTLKTNKYGSVSGKFALPDTGLTGPYHIKVDGKGLEISGNHQISVEEYKRPKFETNFSPITKVYKINDNVELKAYAKAFAGTPITDAKVLYRVHREVQYPHWWYWHRPLMFSQPQEITYGETVTDDEGNYTINFKALADKTIKSEEYPVFNYKIIAEVTDINGETHTAETIVKVGYHTTLLSVSNNSNWNVKGQSEQIIIEARNLNDQKIKSQGVICIYKLKHPKQVKRKRPWASPDFMSWKEDEFNKLFPHDIYSTHNNINKGRKVFEQNFATTTLASDTIKINEYSKWHSGKYLVEVEVKDKNGQTLVERTQFELQDNEQQKVSDNQLLVFYTDKESYQPGDKVTLRVGTASSKATLFVYVEKDEDLPEIHKVELNNEIKTLTLPVTTDDLGGFAIHYSLANLNSSEMGVVHVNVDLPLSPLDFEVATFTDKLQPGSPQTWQFRLKGLGKDLRAGEVLASMYDVSLDQFKPNKWQKPYLQPYRVNMGRLRLDARYGFSNTIFNVQESENKVFIEQKPIQLSHLNWFGFSLNPYEGMMMYRNVETQKGAIRTRSLKKENKVLSEAAAKPMLEMADEMVEEEMFEGDVKDKNVIIETPEGILVKEQILEDKKIDMSEVTVRKNFKETAFFYPQLLTDDKGNVTFSFKTPEALTRWRLQLLGHTTKMETAYHSVTAVTQKELMVQPNPPRFLREGDKIVISSKISNLSDKVLNGQVLLELTDAITGKNIDQKLLNKTPKQNFTVKQGSNTSVFWELQIPYDVQAVQYKVVAKSNQFSDGEQNILPVLSNRMLVTETLPMWINSNETKSFTLDKLKNNKSTTLKHHKLTLEVTSNPVWYAIQVLPYLIEYPYKCSEQTFSRLYANALASKIINDNPSIKSVFKQWKNTDELVSNLEKNEELKSLIISETPWLRDAQSETEQKKRIALLFDLDKSRKSLQKAENKLQDMQFYDGGFPWFKGSHDPNRYVTQHIVSGFGHLKKLGAYPIQNTNTHNINNMLEKALDYMDREILLDYKKLQKEVDKIKKLAKNKREGEKDSEEYLEKKHLGALQLQYLYARRFYDEFKIKTESQKAVDYYTKQACKFWSSYNLAQKSMIALLANHHGNHHLAQQIIKSLEEYSITNQEMGMYWKSNQSSWQWYQAPIETQSLLIEAFAEIKPNQKQLDLMKIWLLKNKQTNRWATTKATTEAIYALLAYGTDWIIQKEPLEVMLGRQKITTENQSVEAGTGYFKTSIEPSQITKEKAEVTLSKKDKGIAWGGLYWQYFEDLDKINFAKTPLAINKKLFIKQNTGTGEKLKLIDHHTKIKVGNLIRVRIEIKVDRDMNFVHMKDMRATGLEPVSVLSQYKYQDGLGYYESTKDASTDFFFSQLKKGVYVFEYDLRVNNAGVFSNGITTIQCMYAPEFTSHSEGMKININRI